MSYFLYYIIYYTIEIIGEYTVKQSRMWCKTTKAVLRYHLTVQVYAIKTLVKFLKTASLFPMQTFPSSMEWGLLTFSGTISGLCHFKVTWIYYQEVLAKSDHCTYHSNKVLITWSTTLWCHSNNYYYIIIDSERWLAAILCEVGMLIGSHSFEKDDSNGLQPQEPRAHKLPINWESYVTKRSS